MVYQLTTMLITVNYLSEYLKKTYLLEKTDWVFIFNSDKGDWLPQPVEEADFLFLAIQESIKNQKTHNCGF